MVEFVEHLDALLYKFRFIFVGTLIACCLVVLSIMVTGIHSSACFTNRSGHSVSSNSYGLGGSEDANAVTAGVFSAADSLGRSLSSTSQVISCSTRSTTAIASSGAASVGTAFAASGKGFANVGKGLGRAAVVTVSAMGHGIQSGAIVTVVAASNSASFVAGALSSMTTILWHVAPLSMVVQPASHIAVPVIDNGAPLPLNIASVIPAAQTISQPSTAVPAPLPVQWPLHGTITTEFGVPEPPYQPIHTGIDISDGQRSPIHPFKVGRVAEVIHSGSGLGNHIIVDHGDGITSVYGHLSSTAVAVGQPVNLDTVLGYEGSTGASTGTHLHFEIYVNGVVNNPHHFITGQP